MDGSNAQHNLGLVLNETVLPESVHHIISGSFRSISLFLLAFSPSKRSLSHLQTIPAFGPHQYLAANGPKNRVYTTSWALPPSLSSWGVDRRSDPWKVTHINTTPITATSSYITIPPPHTHIYSAGGPTGEVHVLDPDTGGFGEKTQQILFVPEDELAAADKTRVALRYGSHGIEFTPSRRFAFAPILGTDTIEMYSHDPSSGHLTHLVSVGSPRGRDAKDGPRHVKVHPNGRVLYCVTEHSNLVDAYRILPTTLKYLSSRSLLPKHLTSTDSSHAHSQFRGDTLLLPPSTPSNPTPRFIVTTTRGSTPSVRGWLSILPLDEGGDFASPPLSSEDPDKDVERNQTPTSGGKANAIDILPKDTTGGLSEDSSSEAVWILLTDDDDATAAPEGTGAVRVLEWDGWGTGGVRVVAEWPPGVDLSEESEMIQGASHAIWLD